jgi:uncharacterized membrane protein
MDGIGGVLLLVFVVLILPWLLFLRSRHLRKKDREEFDSRWAEMTRRMVAVERTVQEIRLTQAIIASAQAHQGQPGTPGERSPESERTEERVSSARPAWGVTPAAQVFGEPQAGSPIHSESVPAIQPEPEARLRADELHASFLRKYPAPLFSSTEAATTWFDRLKGGFDLEEAMGTNWLNKIGIVILVFGIAFFLAYQLRELGPAGKVSVGCIVSAALLGGGVFLERRAGYVLLARAGIGGGWALAFFTAYATHHVEAARVLSSQAADLVLMGMVAAGMVAHSLRYRSQVVTGLAFLLAYSTVTISHVTVYSLSAGVVLSLALVIIVLRMRWYELEVLGLAAAYLNHSHWLYQIIEPMHGHKRAFPEFVPSAAILISYWLIFRVSYILRKPESDSQERIATAAALLNSFGLLCLFKYQALHPEWAFYALLVLGAAEMVMAMFARRRRRVAFAVLATIGVTLLFAAVPFRFSMMNVSMLWMAGTEALLLVGIATRERVFRRLSFASAGAAAIQMLAVDTARILGVRADDAMPGRVLPLGFALGFAAVLYYANSLAVPRRWRDLFDDLDIRILRLLSYGALLLAAAGIWIALPGVETSPAWACAALLLAWISARAAFTEMRIQGDALSIAAFLRAIAVNLQTSGHWGHLSQRMLTVAICAAALYLGSRVKTGYSWPLEFRIQPSLVPALYSWVGSTLLGSLLWYELRSVSIAPAWALFGLALVEIGVSRQSLQLRIQGYVALAGSLVRVFTANLSAAGVAGTVSPRLYTVVPIALIFSALYFRLDGERSSLHPTERRLHVAEVHSWVALACFVGLVRFELQPDWVVVAWAALVPVLLAIAWRTKRLLFMHQALVLTWLTVFRGAMHNLYERDIIPAPFLYSRALCVSITCALLLLSLALAYQLKDAQAAANQSASRWRRALTAAARHPEQVLFFAPFTLIISLLGAEMSKGLLTVSWSVLGVATFLFALWMGERSFRLAGLGLLLVGVGKIVVIDVWSLNARDRYLTFISMGTALLIVSFLYTRFREAIRQFL